MSVWFAVAWLLAMVLLAAWVARSVGSGTTHPTARRRRRPTTHRTHKPETSGTHQETRTTCRCGAEITGGRFTGITCQNCRTNTDQQYQSGNSSDTPTQTHSTSI